MAAAPNPPKAGAAEVVEAAPKAGGAAEEVVAAAPKASGAAALAGGAPAF